MRHTWTETEVTGSVAGWTDVRFKCRYWAKDVTVEMISPFAGKRNSVHMLYAIPSRYTDGDRWRIVAWGLVREILESK